MTITSTLIQGNDKQFQFSGKELGLNDTETIY